MFRRSRLFLASTAITLSAIVATADAQVKVGAINSKNLGPAGVPGAPVPSKNDIEAGHHQDIRSDRLAAMERLLKARHPDFTTAEDEAKKRMGEGKPTLPTLTEELKAISEIAKKIRDARRVLVESPTVPVDLEKIGKELDAAVHGLTSVKKDDLAADLIRLGLGTVSKAALLEAKPANLLPVLLASFLGQLQVGDLIGELQQAKLPPEAMQTEFQKLDVKLDASRAKLNAYVKP